MLVTRAIELLCDQKPYVIKTDNGAQIPARTVVIATGAEYRRPKLNNLSLFEGLGYIMLQHLWKHNCAVEMR